MQVEWLKTMEWRMAFFFFWSRMGNLGIAMHGMGFTVFSLVVVGCCWLLLVVVCWRSSIMTYVGYGMSFH